MATSSPEEDDKAPPSDKVWKVTVLAGVLERMFNPEALLAPTPAPAPAPAPSEEGRGCSGGTDCR